MKIVWDFHELVEFGERLNDYPKFESYLKSATQEIAKALHKALVTRTPVVTGKLKQGWNSGENLAFTVQKVKDGYLVELTNNVEYASHVNYGHPSHNQFNKGGQPYVVRNRVKVPVADPRQNPKSQYWVFGRFFLENSVVEVDEQLEQIVSKELQKWLEWCVSGK
jgi:hypothetical protein